MRATDFPTDDPALRALLLPLDRGAVVWPADGRVLFLGARADSALHTRETSGLVCQQPFRPFADQLERGGLRVREPAGDERFALVMLLPSRQREVRQAQLARALDHLAGDGTLLVAVANPDGARSAQTDLEQLVGPVEVMSKHKCRVFWVASPASVDVALQRQWASLDAPRPTVDGLLGRPGLFAWDRVDPASALLAGHFPPDMEGHVADLGSGAGYLSVQLIKRCPRVNAIDLFEAAARALPVARANLDRACREQGREVACTLHWHDVVTGLPGRFDHIVSNPPFHQGRADLPQLGRAFIAAAAAALRPGGRFHMVANRHLPYEATLREHFTRVDTRVEEGGFKVIEARR